jgi:hypothetical protein
VQESAGDEEGGAWARDRAIIQPEEQPATPPPASAADERGEQKRRDLASGTEDRG